MLCPQRKLPLFKPDNPTELALVDELRRAKLSREAATQLIADIDAAALGDAPGFAGRAAAITCSRREADLPRRADVKCETWPAGILGLFADVVIGCFWALTFKTHFAPV